MKLHPLIRIGLVALMLLVAFLAGQQYSRPVAAQSHQKCEYEIVGSGFGGNGQVDKLNKLERTGRADRCAKSCRGRTATRPSDGG